MNPAPAREPALTESEWTIVIDLLKREQAALPSEIHHTSTRNARKELEARLELVESALGKLPPA